MPGLLYQQPQGLLSEPEQGLGLLGALYQNPLLARQVAAQRQAREVPTSVTDPRWAQHQAIQKQADNFLLGADILGALAPVAKPLGLLAGRAAAPALEGYMARTGLLQSAAPYNPPVPKPDPTEIRRSVEAFADATKQAHGLERFNVYYKPSTGSLELADIEVPKAMRKQGIGTRAMEDLVKYADENGLRIELTPALRDPRHGTTSRSRLVDFYKGFGFYENKGRHKDFTTMAGMLREPQK